MVETNVHSYISDKYPSRWGVLLNIMKNWDPFVLGPLFAIERRPASAWATLKFSSNREKNYNQHHNHITTYSPLKTYRLIYLEISLHIYSLHQCLQYIKSSCFTCLAKKLKLKILCTNCQFRAQKEKNIPFPLEKSPPCVKQKEVMGLTINLLYID